MFSLPLVARFGGGGLSGPIPPLTHMYYVDIATVVPLANQTGNIETPYGTLAQAIAAIGAGTGTIIVVPGDYSAEGMLNFGAGGVIYFIALPTVPILGVSNIIPVPPVTINGLSASRTLYMANVLSLGSVSNVGNNTELVDSQLNAAVSGSGFVFRECMLRAAVTAATVALISCRCSVAGGFTITCTNSLQANGTTWLSSAGSPFNLDVTGTIKFDAFSAFQWHATIGSALLHAGSFVDVIADTPAKMSQDLDASGYAMWHFENLKSAADLALGVGVPVAFPAFIINPTRWGLVNGNVYQVTLRIEVLQWKDDKSATGAVEFVEDALVTVAAGVVTLVFNRTPVSDVRGLVGSPLLLGNAGLSATAGGFTVTATRGAAVPCHARWYAWFNRFDKLLP
jgi:hypothetical protein